MRRIQKSGAAVASAARRLRVYRDEIRQSLAQIESNKSTIEFFTKNFVVISTICTVCASAVVVTFLFSYLSVFSYRLIWLIEASDILKFILVAGALISGATGSMLWLANVLEDLVKNEEFFEKAYKWVSIAYVVLAVLMFWAEALSSKPNYLETAKWLAAISYFIVVFRDCVLIVRHRSNINPYFVQRALFMLLFASTFWGQQYGVRVKGDQSSFVDVQIRKASTDVDTLQHVSIVMLLSHHAVFFGNKTISVVPTGDILRITAQAKDEVP